MSIAGFSMLLSPKEEAFKRIEECRRTRGDVLDLNNLRLTEIPEEVFELFWLKKLELSYHWILGKGEIRQIPTTISQLSELTELSISGHFLSDLDNLQYSSQLRSLDCSSNQIACLSGLKGLAQLNSLDCRQNQLSDLDVLQSLPALLDFSCSQNLLVDLSILEYMPQLQSLNCSHNKLINLDFIRYTPQLQSLECNSNNLKNLGVLQYIPRLKSLSCLSNELTKLSELKYVPELQSLNCSFNQLENLNELRFVVKLQSLKCNDNQLTDANGLQNVPELKLLDCGSNKLNDLSILRYTPKLQSLNFYKNQLRNLNFLQNTPQLEALNCASNEFRGLKALQYLPQLKSLSCASNQVGDLNELQYVNNLEDLNCRDCGLSDLDALKYVPKIEALSCGSNKFVHLSDLRHVPQLKYLECNYNYLTDLKWLQLISQIEWIECRNNQISNIDELYNLVSLGQIISLYLYGNLVQKIPSIIFGDEDSDCQDNLRNYWLDLKKGSVEKNQLKVQFVGNGRVGKTTLAYALEHKKGPDEHFKSTHGITIREIPHTLDSAQDPVSLQFWDFGGQEIYHATHRLFLGDDCLYLLLWAEETEEHPDETRHPVSYWLELIHDLAPNSPIILIKNQIDRSDRKAARPLELSDDELPGVKQIRQDVKISAQHYQRMNSLRGAIEDVLEELKYRVCLELPASWVQVEEDLKQLEQKTIPFAHFQQLCIKAGVNDAKWFADYLHKTGVLFYCEGTFQDQIILDQNWAVEAVYHLFDPQGKKSLIERMSGEFTGSDTKIFWPEVSDAERQVYMGFMSNCGICYQPSHKHNTSFSEQHFIIPALLPETSLAQAFWDINEERDWLLEVSFPFLHRSIIERLIVKLGENSQSSDPWRYGIGCETEHGKVLLECKYENSASSNKGCLLFHLRGTQLEQLLYKLRKLVKDTSPHNRYQEQLAKAGNKEVLEPFIEKEEHLEQGRTNSTMSKKVKLFISYSHKDEDYREQLDIRLKAIERRFPLEVWHDRNLLAGEQVHEKIVQQLEVADIIVLLISPDFVSSDYCFSHEMEIALKLYEEKKNVVIPIIIRDTDDWYSYQIGNHTALPTDGKPVCDWPNEDKFWSDVQKGIRIQVEKLSQS